MHGNHLTVEEIRVHARMECKYPSLKMAFLSVIRRDKEERHQEDEVERDLGKRRNGD